MKNKRFLILSFLLLSSCSNENEEYYYSKNDFDIKEDYHSRDEIDGLEKLTLKIRTSGYLAIASFEAFYQENGIEVNAYVEDSKIYLGNAAPFFDDNIEYVIQTRTNVEGYDVSKTMHVMVTAMNYNYVQKANSINSWGTSFDKTLNINVGKDFYSNTKFVENGYEVNTFISYRLLGTTKEEALGNVTLCPAFRNSISASSSSLASYTRYGCMYSKSNTHMLLTKNNCFVGGKENE